MVFYNQKVPRVKLASAKKTKKNTSKHIWNAEPLVGEFNIPRGKTNRWRTEAVLAAEDVADRHDKAEAKTEPYQA